MDTDMGIWTKIKHVAYVCMHAWQSLYAKIKYNNIKRKTGAENEGLWKKEWKNECVKWD